jgi:ankyrin repeat protein
LLNIACKRGHKEIVNILLKANADINAKDDKNNTPINYGS